MDLEETRGLERERSVSRDTYLADSYFTYDQLWSFVEQLYHIQAMGPRNIVEVGVGNGFVSQFLRTMGRTVLTCDINPELKPDLLVSVTELDQHIKVGEYDLIACCEVLEHMPFEHFEDTIRRFAKLSDKLFLTLPVYGVKFGIGGFFAVRYRRRWFSWWRVSSAFKYEMPPMHFWELGSQRETRLRAITAILQRHYRDVKTDFFKLNPYHRYFRCSGRPC